MDRNETIEKYMVCAERSAGKFYRNRKIKDVLYKDYEDILQEAYLGLIQAADKIDESNNPEAYVCIRAKGRILDAIRKNCWKTRESAIKEKKIEDAKQEAKKNENAELEDKQIAEKTGIEIEEVQKTIQENKYIISMDEMMEDERADKNMKESLLGYEKSPEEILEEKYELEHVQQWIRGKIEHYPRRDRKILEEYFFEQKTVKEIADELVISESRVSQLMKRRMKMLKKSIAIDKESEEVEKYIRRFEQHII